MTAVIDEGHKIIDCPHCKGKLNVEIERKPATVKIEEHQTPNIDAIIEKKLKEREPKEPPKPQLEEKPKTEQEPIVPRYQPKYLCGKDGCEGHQNKNYKERPQKRCTNCNMWGGPKSAKTCPMCGAVDDFEEIDEEELDSLGVPKPGIMHDHGV